MRQDNVPQDDSPTYDGHKKLVYATDKEGHYTGVQSSGWEVESFATSMAVEDLHRLAAEAKQAVLAGTVSPLAYHMYQHRLDVANLAQVSGFFQWQVKRHLQPKIFNKLSQRKLAIYCDVFALSLQQLTQVTEK
ncbi:hypothetical protein RS130_03025 [Paraglaciecola aquimarina]|uniref:HTH cro/C1-type domain-containing protein n=1 Tax=Paraglaciecola aquimarina TaxID=1235557 RepID=A0ABU3SSQ0_9ALTE|nr:hypothetical protein [Paraglaciecola aquimarina]MDU0353044.1 hypothetical protein [Paraglaciecola aquimarina]